MKSRSIKLGLESLESRKLCAADLAAAFQVEPVSQSYMASNLAYYNSSKPADVDRDGLVSPIDALRLIDTLNRIGSVDIRTLNAQRSASRAEGEAEIIGSVDTNNDGSLSPIDVLVVIDALNGQSNVDGQVMITTAFEGFDPEAVEDFDQVFEGNPNIEWVKRTSIDEELPWLFMDESMLESPDLYSDDSEFLPVFTTMNPEALSLPAVAVFSQNGLFAQIVRKNMAENTSVNAAPVTYFSSNFLKGLR